MKLIELTEKYEKAFREFYDDFAHNDHKKSRDYQEGNSHFLLYIKNLSNESKGYISVRDTFHVLICTKID